MAPLLFWTADYQVVGFYPLWGGWMLWCARRSIRKTLLSHTLCLSGSGQMGWDFMGTMTCDQLG